METSTNTISQDTSKHKARWGLRAEVPPWTCREIEGAVADLLELIDCGFIEFPELREIGEELQKAEPSWEAIRAAIRHAQRASERRYGLNFRRLEARLSVLFSQHKRDWLRPAA